MKKCLSKVVILFLLSSIPNNLYLPINGAISSNQKLRTSPSYRSPNFSQMRKLDSECGLNTKQISTIFNDVGIVKNINANDFNSIIIPTHNQVENRILKNTKKAIKSIDTIMPYVSRSDVFLLLNIKQAMTSLKYYQGSDLIAKTRFWACMLFLFKIQSSWEHYKGNSSIIPNKIYVPNVKYFLKLFLGSFYNNSVLQPNIEVHLMLPLCIKKMISEIKRNHHILLDAPEINYDTKEATMIYNIVLAINKLNTISLRHISFFYCENRLIDFYAKMALPYIKNNNRLQNKIYRLADIVDIIYNTKLSHYKRSLLVSGYLRTLSSIQIVGITQEVTSYYCGLVSYAKSKCNELPKVLSGNLLKHISFKKQKIHYTNFTWAKLKDTDLDGTICDYSQQYKINSHQFNYWDSVDIGIWKEKFEVHFKKIKDQYPTLNNKNRNQLLWIASGICFIPKDELLHRSIFLRNKRAKLKAQYFFYLLYRLSKKVKNKKLRPVKSQVFKNHINCLKVMTYDKEKIQEDLQSIERLQKKEIDKSNMDKRVVEINQKINTIKAIYSEKVDKNINLNYYIKIVAECTNFLLKRISTFDDLSLVKDSFSLLCEFAKCYLFEKEKFLFQYLYAQFLGLGLQRKIEKKGHFNIGMYFPISPLNI